MHHRALNHKAVLIQWSCTTMYHGVTTLVHSTTFWPTVSTLSCKITSVCTFHKSLSATTSLSRGTQGKNRHWWHYNLYYKQLNPHASKQSTNLIPNTYKSTRLWNQHDCETARQDGWLHSYTHRQYLRLHHTFNATDSSKVGSQKTNSEKEERKNDNTALVFILDATYRLKLRGCCDLVYLTHTLYLTLLTGPTKVNSGHVFVIASL